RFELVVEAVRAALYPALRAPHDHRPAAREDRHPEGVHILTRAAQPALMGLTDLRQPAGELAHPPASPYRERDPRFHRPQRAGIRHTAEPAQAEEPGRPARRSLSQARSQSL